MNPRVLVVGVGNLLRRDDGFGPEVARRLSECADLPTGVRVTETGIGGVALVQDLMDRYDAVVILDTVRRGGAPGTLYLLEPEVPDIRSWTPEERHAFLADLHQVEPSGALVLAAALGVLPPVVRILACEPADCDEAEIGLTPAVARAAELAIERTRRLVIELAEEADGPAGLVPAPNASHTLLTHSTPACHSERSEESPGDQHEILRSAQNDKGDGCATSPGKHLAEGKPRTYGMSLVDG